MTKFFAKNNKENSKIEAMFFGGKNEILDGFFFQDPESFLKNYAPNRVRVLKNALKKIKFKFNGTFMTDLTMPMNVGGYFAPGHDILAISPMLLLYGSEKDIAHVLFHEGLHAGIYTGAPVEDESLVETMTKKKMAEVYGGPQFKSGYDSMVNELSTFFGDMSFEDMTEMVEDGDKQTFDNLIESIVVGPSIGQGLEGLSWEELKRKLAGSWSMLQRLFPRMMNNIAGKNVGPHATADMSLQHYELDGILAKAAERVLSGNPEMITSLFDQITKDGEENMETDLMIKEIYNAGFGYLYDFDSTVVEKLIGEYLAKSGFEKLSNYIATFDPAVKLANINIALANSVQSI